MANTKTAARGKETKTPSRTGSPKEWTIMVYLAGDNNLTEDMVDSLLGLRDAMQKRNVNDRINVVAAYDSVYPTVRITYYKFDYRDSPGDLASYVAWFPEKPTTPRSSRDTLYIKKFVKWSTKNFPAENYAMIMSGHSDAILDRTTFRDENPDTRLSLRELARWLRESARGNLKKKRFDIVGFDSCLMGMIEVGCQLGGKADYLVASQGLAPNAGWAYGKVLKTLVAKKGRLSPKKFAESIVVNQIESSKDFRISGRFMSLSSVRLWDESAVGPKKDKAIQIKRRIDDLGEVFNNVLFLPTRVTSRVPKPIAQANVFIKIAILKLIHDSHYESQTSLHEQAVDVLDFVERLDHNCRVKNHEILTILSGKPPSGPVKRLLAFIDQIMKKCRLLKADLLDGDNGYIQESKSSGPDYQFAKGVSLFFPWTRTAFDMVYNTYSNLRFTNYGDSQWMRFVEKYTELTIRPSTQPAAISDKVSIEHWFNENAEYGKDTVAQEEKDTRSGTLKSGTLKSSEDDLYYRLFRRFRNFPIRHNTEHQRK